jgi:hypothetical protein
MRTDFPEGAPLVVATRTTAAALEVEEVPGDPLSHDLADVYVTRAEYDQGDLHGPLVCATFVEQPGIVEITVAPETCDPETGRPSMPAPPSAVPAETPRAPAPSPMLSREEALAVSHVAAPGTEDWEVLVATAGPIREVNPNWNLLDWSRHLPEQTRIWYVALASGDEGVMVFLDATDGTVYDVSWGIVN